MVKENIFDKKLKKLDEDLTRMGELCEIAIAEATKALIEGNTDQARAVIEADEEIDQMAHQGCGRMRLDFPSQYSLSAAYFNT